MAVTLVETPGGATSNTYATVAEANAYFNARLPLSKPWDEADDPTAALAMAARILDALAQARRSLIVDKSGDRYYLTARAWTGAPATTTQRMAWPRTGMYDANGNAIASNVIPQALKDAQCELAGQLIIADTTLDNDVIVQGITSVKAGSVAVTFKDMVERHVLPDAVWLLMPESWFTDEIYEPALRALFDVIA